MVTHYLRTELRSELEAVELAWDALLRLDAGAADEALITPILEFFRRNDGPWLLLGQREIADYLSRFDTGAIRFEPITVEGRGSLSEAALGDLIGRARDRMARGAVHIFVCLTDRYDAHRVVSALPQAFSIHTFDVLKDLVGERIPPSSWRKRFDHIYPIAIPEIEIRKNLDVLLLDMPARSLAQLPIGFAYVYKAIRQTGVSLQAIDVDLIAYHRYHSRRCLNYVDRIYSDGMLHPQDPWQAENYIVWTDRKFIDYFSDILDEIVDKVIEARPKVMGFSLHQTSHVSVNYVVERVREALPDICVVVGGMSCYQHFVARRIFPQADYVVVGEADTVIGALAEALARGERPRDLPGIVSRHDTEGRTFIGAPLPHNLDIVGAPDYDFTDLDSYVNWNGYRLMPLVGSRGCGWSRCTFCAERFNWRARTPETVAEEIEYYTTRGFKDFVFNESDFNSNLSFVTRLCREIVRRGIKANFTAQLRVGKDCDEEYYKTMKEAGFSCLRFGVDGLSENTLRLQCKGYTKQMVMDNLKHCYDHGIFTEINVVVGVPGETDADVEEAADFIIEMKPYIGRVAFINPLMLFVGSVYYFEPERHKIGFIGNKDELYRQYFVSLPDSSWYSEEPYIDHEIRRQRFFRIVERIHSVGVPLGAFANFTAAFRKTHKEDSHTVSQPRPIAENTDAVAAAPAVVSNSVERSQLDITAWAGESLAPSAPLEEKTEFQKTFYGSWSSAFLSGDSWQEAVPLLAPQVRVVRIEGSFYLTKDGAAEKLQLVKVYAAPVLLRSYKGYNLVGYHDQILGAPIALGPADLTRDEVRNNPCIVKEASEEDVTRIIDHAVAAASLAAGVSPAAVEVASAVAQGGARASGTSYDSPCLLRSYKGYNLVGYGRQVLGAPIALGHIDLNQESARMDPRILKGRTEDEVIDQIDGVDNRSHEHASRESRDDFIPVSSLRKINMGVGVLLRSGK